MPKWLTTCWVLVECCQQNVWCTKRRSYASYHIQEVCSIISTLLMKEQSPKSLFLQEVLWCKVYSNLDPSGSLIYTFTYYKILMAIRKEKDVNKVLLTPHKETSIWALEPEQRQSNAGEFPSTPEARQHSWATNHSVALTLFSLLIPTLLPTTVPGGRLPKGAKIVLTHLACPIFIYQLPSNMVLIKWKKMFLQDLYGRFTFSYTCTIV